VKITADCRCWSALSARDTRATTDVVAASLCEAYYRDIATGPCDCAARMAAATAANQKRAVRTFQVGAIDLNRLGRMAYQRKVAVRLTAPTETNARRNKNALSDFFRQGV